MALIPTYDSSNYPTSISPTSFPYSIVSGGKLTTQLVYNVSSAQLLALQTTAIALVAALGASWAIVPNSMALQYKFGTTAYTIGNADNKFQIEYTGKATNLLSALATGLVDQVVNEIVIAKPAVAGANFAQTNMANLGLELKLTGTTPALTLGDGTLIVTVGYEVLVLQ